MADTTASAPAIPQAPQDAAPEASENLASLSADSQVFAPSERALSRTLTPDFDALCEAAAADPEGYWEARAQELEWAAPWTQVLDWKPAQDGQPPSVKWFVGAKCNITLNALDRHVRDGRGDKLAFLWVGEAPAQAPASDVILDLDQSGNRITPSATPLPNQQAPEQRVSYAQVLARVNQAANALKKLGVKEGDRVTIYMSLTPELPIAMLACARIGAIHCVVYGGFSAPALASRIDDSESKIVIASDLGWRRGKRIELKKIVDEAVSNLPQVEKVLVLRRDPSTPLGERDVDFGAVLEAESTECEAAVLDAEAPLFFLYTSGTTGKPKGVIHVHGGYAVGTSTTHRLCFDLHDDDLYFCTADPGWITGHSYVVYGPLINGASVLLAEGALDFPDAGRWWSIVQKYKPTIFYSTPTAIRALMRFGEEFPAKYDLSSLQVLGTVGEPINPEAWMWFHKHVGAERTPIVDTWWQTETGQFMISTVPSFPTKPGSPGRALPGVIADVVDKEGQPVAPGAGGFLVIKSQWPAMMRGIYKDPERFAKYWELIPGFYAAGDVATKDEDGYFRVMGRADDVMNVSGYRIGTAEVESALVSHPAVAESAVIGKPDPLKGESIKAFVILREGQSANDELLKELKLHVRTELSPIAVPSEIEFVPSLPKTRSGKIMRRVLKAKELGVAPGDISTLED
jgi:acetyl-CoA synthetase